MKRIRFAEKISMFVIIAIIGFLAGAWVLPVDQVQARDFPNWQAGGKADGFVDYFEENGIWYLVTLKPDGNKHGQVYAAGALDGIRKIVIPDSFKHSKKDYDVLGINDHAFDGDDTITDVEVKKGVKYMGSYAFYNCTCLTTVKLADSVNEIGTGAFMGCTALNTVNIPDGLKEMPEAMFNGCTALTKIDTGKNVTKIGKGAFLSCTGLKTVKFGSNLKEIDDQAFSLCGSLVNPKFPSKITRIGAEAFYHCDSFTDIALPKKVKIVEQGCFSWCENLKTIKLPAAVTKIENSAFEYCTKLKKVKGKNKKLISIGYSAFSYCESLADIRTPKVREIENLAFYGTGLTKINLTKLEKLGDSAFAYSKLKSVTIPGTVKSVAESAFEMCRELKSATLKEGVESIEDAAFRNCSKMTDFSYPESLQFVKHTSLERSAWLEIKLGKEIAYNNVGDIYYYHQNGANYPDSFSIGDICIYINNMERYINDYGYETERYKQVIEFPAGTKVISCELGTGNECTKVVIPEGCEVLDGMINFVGHRVNSDFTPVELVLPKSLKVLTARLSGEGLTKVRLPENLETLGSHENNSKWFVFDGATALTSVHFDGNKLEYIGCGCFSNTPDLTEIYLPEGITEIGDYAFYNSGLKEINLPMTLEKIGDCSFQQSKLTSVELPEGITDIGISAFYGTPLSLVTSPHKTKLGDGSCSLPESVRNIGISAFGNTELDKFVLPDRFEIQCEITDNRQAVMYVKKGSAAEKALKEFLNSYTDLWTVKQK